MPDPTREHGSTPPRDNVTPGDDSPPQSSLTAAELLSRLIDLVAARRRMADFDTATVAAALAPDGADDGSDDSADGKLWRVARLTAQWRSLVQFDPAEPVGPMLRLEFFDSRGGREAPMTEIAQLDLDQFSERMRAAGYAEQEIGDEFGGSRGRDFTAGDLRVTVTSAGEDDSPPDKVAHRCVWSVTVR